MVPLFYHGNASIWHHLDAPVVPKSKINRSQDRKFAIAGWILPLPKPAKWQIANTPQQNLLRPGFQSDRGNRQNHITAITYLKRQQHPGKWYQGILHGQPHSKRRRKDIEQYWDWWWGGGNCLKRQQALPWDEWAPQKSGIVHQGEHRRELWSAQHWTAVQSLGGRIHRQSQ